MTIYGCIFKIYIHIYVFIHSHKVRKMRKNSQKLGFQNDRVRPLLYSNAMIFSIRICALTTAMGFVQSATEKN